MAAIYFFPIVRIKYFKDSDSIVMVIIVKSIVAVNQYKVSFNYSRPNCFAFMIGSFGFSCHKFNLLIFDLFSLNYFMIIHENWICTTTILPIRTNFARFISLMVLLFNTKSYFLSSNARNYHLIADPIHFKYNHRISLEVIIDD